MLKHVFVYGTLKQGQCREACWPLPPQLVRHAWTLGELYDTGPYPALIPGSDMIAGEIWSYPEHQEATVLQRLDQIEGTNQAGFSNEYDRELVQVELLSGEQLPASTYFYARRQAIVQFARVYPSRRWRGKTVAIWPADAQWGLVAD